MGGNQECMVIHSWWNLVAKQNYAPEQMALQILHFVAPSA